MTEPQASLQPHPVLTVLRGNPAPDELAALLVVLRSRSRSRAADPGRGPSPWSSPGRRLRVPLLPGPGAWRESGLPG
jgi:hypothetical protein